MTQIVLILNNPTSLVRGIIRNCLFEPAPNVFVGNLDRKRIEALLRMLADTQTTATICAASKFSPIGTRFKTIGDAKTQRFIIDIDGLQFVKKAYKSNR